MSVETILCVAVLIAHGWSFWEDSYLVIENKFWFYLKMVRGVTKLYFWDFLFGFKCSIDVR